MTRWQNPELQKHLAELSSRGLSAARIAEGIGESPDAVAGAMRRYGLFAKRGNRGHAARAKPNPSERG